MFQCSFLTKKKKKKRNNNNEGGEGKEGGGGGGGRQQQGKRSCIMNALAAEESTGRCRGEQMRIWKAATWC